jgi:hypothetical protein
MVRVILCVASIGLVEVLASSLGAQTSPQRPGRPSPVVQNASTLSDPKDAVQKVISEKNSRISKFYGLGQSLLKIGQPAIDELTAALETADAADRGYIALALGLFGSDAKIAIPKLIDAFPLEPTQEIGILLDKDPTSEEFARLL